jgi:4-amino-4-deoxy-L-arabinose transferase-like glycosyltransferase
MKKDILIILVVFIVLAFFFRIGSFKREHPLSFDESVYPKLAVQISENPANYNTKGIYQDATEKGRKLPAYFNDPLFKHPPLFSYLISFSFKIFGRTYYSAFKVSLFFGVLLIGMAYLLGSTLFDEKTGVYAALLMFMEPISWITSQKIWMETTLAFFTILSICLFALVIKKYNPYLMIASGISAGLAALTKYPGILPVVGILIYAACFERWLFKKKSFYLALITPVLVMLPWAWWNYSVYGLEQLTTMKQTGNVARFFGNLGRFQEPLWGLVFIAILLIVGRKKIFSAVHDLAKTRKKLLFSVFIFGLLGVLTIIFRGYIVNALNPKYIPPTGWIVGMFNKEPYGFYPWKLMELSPLYIFTYISLAVFLFDEQKQKKYLFLYVFSAVLLVFWIGWAGYQCRYITALTVPLIVLSARAQWYIFQRLRAMPSKNMSLAAQGVFLMCIAYLMIKTLRVDLMLAVPNTACYF